MRRLFDSPFLECVQNCVKNSELSQSEMLLDFYEDFTQKLNSLVGTQQSLLTLSRCLRIAHIELRAMLRHVEKIKPQQTELIITLAWKAQALIEMELEIVALKIEHYGLREDADTIVSSIHWAKEYTESDLMELILALHESGALRNRDGSCASFVAIVRLMEQAFNIRLKDYRGIKRNVTTRKIRLIKFLDVLSNSFITLCESRMEIR